MDKKIELEWPLTDKKKIEILEKERGKKTGAKEKGSECKRNT